MVRWGWEACKPKLWPRTDQQRCSVHEIANVLEKLPKAMECLDKDRISMLAMAFKLMETAQKERLRLRVYKLLIEAISSVKFVDSIKQTGDQKQVVA
ncbi:hypothetical protein [Nitrosomonas sp. Nm132]|jgi:transposase-like protein|uniref:hypothetical protein n=1 Tax=Nitrosomonas sp. Nm132 TaxID=1881053 RepID=UPI00088A738B|nr:hypothetical protein [Nitrosomonas sp. Nm132]SDH35065.1 hypothetical protein SAMN05428952_101130 [Nitrosomonas sp. Nm132]